MGEQSYEMPPPEKPPEKRLDSWKEIAVYLNRDVTTVQRWEKREGMPVHRHVHDKRGSVYAIPEELDAWVLSRNTRLDEPEKEPETRTPLPTPGDQQTTVERGPRRWLALAAILCLCLAAAGWLCPLHRASGRPKIRSLAVLPLRRLSGDPRQDYLAER